MEVAFRPRPPPTAPSVGPKCHEPPSWLQSDEENDRELQFPLTTKEVAENNSPPRCSPEVSDCGTEATAARDRTDEVIFVKVKENGNVAEEAAFLARLERRTQQRMSKNASRKEKDADNAPRRKKKEKKSLSKEHRRELSLATRDKIEEPAVDTAPNLPTPSLSEEQERLLAPQVALFGLETIAKHNSSSHHHRLSALHSIIETSLVNIRKAPVETIDLSLWAFGSSLGDPVFSVAVQGAKCILTILETAAFIPDGVVRIRFGAAVAALMTRLRDGNFRVHIFAINLLSDFANSPHIGSQFILEAICNLTGCDFVAKELLGRMTVCTNILKCSVSTEVLACMSDGLLCLAHTCLSSTNTSVRQHAIQFISQSLRKKLGREAVLVGLVGVKPATLKLVEEALEENLAATTKEEEPQMSTIIFLRRQQEDDLATVSQETLSEGQCSLARSWKDQHELFSSAQCLFSSNWKIRERFLSRLRFFITDLGRHPPENLVVIAKICETGLRDPVPAVVTAALQILDKAMKLITDPELISFEQLLVPALILLVTSSKGLNYESCNKILLHFAETSPVIEDLVLTEAIGALGSMLKQSERRIVAKFKVAEKIAARAERNGKLQLKNYFAGVVESLQHPSGKVRTAAVSLAVTIAKNSSANDALLFFDGLSGNAVEEAKTEVEVVRLAQLKACGKATRRLASVLQPLGQTRPESSPNALPGSVPAPPKRSMESAPSGLSIKSRMLQWKNDGEEFELEVRKAAAENPLALPTETGFVHGLALRKPSAIVR